MRILLDENFPLALLRRLRSQDLEAEHLIESGKRGLPDLEIRRWLEDEALLFLTQDGEFLTLPAASRATVLVSRVRQSRPIEDRVEVWMRAIQAYLELRPPQRLFEVTDTGVLLPWTSA